METIYSLVTLPINQNVAIIRISGPETFFVVQKMFKNKINLKENFVQYQKIYTTNDEYIDEGLVLSFVGPNSFTGEDVVELQFHGSLFVIEQIISMLTRFNLRQAEPGEFMKQAFMNNKMDLSQTEAVNTLILTQNKDLAKLATANINGKESKVIHKVVKKLGEVLANIEILIDYPENEDLPAYNLTLINKNLKIYITQFTKMIDDSKRLIKVSGGIKVALVGKPNVGKSTLLNALLKEDRAIVSPVAGTTRDVIEKDLYLNGIQLTLQDTAGIRKAIDEIEKEGINRTNKTIKEADIVIKLLDGEKGLKKELASLNYINKLNPNIIDVITKGDLKLHQGFITISALRNNLSELLDALELNIKTNFFDINLNNNSLLVTQNQIDKFSEALGHLQACSDMISAGHSADIIMFELEQTLKVIGKIIGLEVDQDYITNLFASFCVGK